MSKKILLISYYWPPVAGGGVHRWMKMSKYIPDLGWDMHVFTPEPSEFTMKDDSLLGQVNEKLTIVKKPIWEPYGIYRKFTGKKNSDKMYSGFIEEKGGKSFTKKASMFIRGNFFIPDARKFWIKPSIPFLNNYIKENNIEYIISTGPPHSMHLIAHGLKMKNKNLKWVADFRDPWTNINFYDKLKTTSWADNIQKKLELKVLKDADKIVTVSWSWAKDFDALCQRKDIEVITNGFDTADFKPHNKTKSKKFSLIHIGSMNPDRNPVTLWNALKRLIQEKPNLKAELEIKLIGVVDHHIIKSINDYGLGDYLNKIDFLPHQQALAALVESEILILPINKTKDSMGILPGKLYEYLGANRKIFCLCPEGSDAEKIIKETNAGKVIKYGENELAFETLLKWYKNYTTEEENQEQGNILKYSRKELAKEYIKLLESI